MVNFLDEEFEYSIVWISYLDMKYDLLSDHFNYWKTDMNEKKYPTFGAHNIILYKHLNYIKINRFTNEREACSQSDTHIIILSYKKIFSGPYFRA